MSDRHLIDLLYFVWRWKLVSTKALMHKFYRDCAPNTAYNRLLSYRHERLLTISSDSRGENYAFSLDKAGFSLLRDRLPALRSEGFRSDKFQHDLVVTAAHLGEWIDDPPAGVHLFTEQELRRIHYDYYPKWVPKPPMSQSSNDYLHIPDGYWHLPLGNDGLTLALEVELTLKTHARYRSVFKFYSDHANIFRVIWMVPKRAWAEVLMKVMRHSPFAKFDIHNFICIDEFQKFGWGAKVFHGPEKERTVFSLLHFGAGNSSGCFPAQLHLDTRKSPHKSTRSAIPDFSAFVD